jgi:hypothetical protein
VNWFPSNNASDEIVERPGAKRVGLVLLGA